MVPEKQNATNIIFCHFGPFFSLFPFSFTFFYPFIFWPFLKTWKIKNFEKMKKAYGDIIILHKCTKKHDHMLHCSRDTTHDRCNFHFLFRAIFCPFKPLPPSRPLPLKTKNIKILKKWTKHRQMSSFYTCVPKIMVTWYTVPEIWCVIDERTDWRTNGWTDRKSDI